MMAIIDGDLHLQGVLQLIEKLSVKNFKSIEELDLDCGRVNVFIGEPNSGKSNILESLGLLSKMFYSGFDLGSFVRMNHIMNLFHDDDVTERIVVKLRMGSKEKAITVSFDRNELIWEDEKGQRFSNFMGVTGGEGSQSLMNEFEFVKPYKFKELVEYYPRPVNYLYPPFGDNLFFIIYQSKENRALANDFFKKFGYDIVFRPQENKLEIQKNRGGTLINHPYNLVSETLKRIVFFTFAMESNKNSTLIFEEPEAHAFPYYTGYLGERIALDATNQYFIATHNPYLLSSIVDKTRASEVKVHLTYLRDYRTEVRTLDNGELEELMTYDPFLNMGRFVPEG